MNPRPFFLAALSAASLAAVPAASAATMRADHYVGAGHGPTLIAGPGTTAATIARDYRWEARSRIALGPATERVTIYPYRGFPASVGNCAPGVDGCSTPGASYATDRAAFYWEVGGHQSDFENVITQSDRDWIRSEIGLTHWNWTDTVPNLLTGREDGAEAPYADVVQDCAMGNDDASSTIHLGYLTSAPATGPMPVMHIGRNWRSICSTVSAWLS